MNREDKLKKREPYIRMSFAFMMVIPLLSIGLLYLDKDVSQLTGIFATASATFGAIIIAHFGLSPKEDGQ